MAQLPKFQTNDQTLSLLQTKWTSILNPIIANPMTNMQVIENVTLINGATTINHLLQRQMQGWTILDVNAAATIYRSQPMNDTTITLTSNAACIIKLGVF